MKRKLQIKRLKKLYDQVPKVTCKGLCTKACGPIVMTTLEGQRIKDLYGLTMKRTCIDKGLECSLLSANGRCRAYNARPLICRLYGVVPGMQCPHGCKRRGNLTDAEAGRLIDQVTELSDGQLIGSLPERIRITNAT